MARVVTQEFRDPFESTTRAIANQLASIDKRNESQARAINNIRQAMLRDPMRFRDGAEATVNEDGMIDGNTAFNDGSVLKKSNLESHKDTSVDTKMIEDNQALAKSEAERKEAEARQRFQESAQAKASETVAEAQGKVLGNNTGIPNSSFTPNPNANPAAVLNPAQPAPATPNATAPATPNNNGQVLNPSETPAPAQGKKGKEGKEDKDASGVKEVMTKMGVGAKEGYGLNSSYSENTGGYKATNTYQTQGQIGWDVNAQNRVSSDELMFQGLLYNAGNASDPTSIAQNPFMKAAETALAFENQVALLGADEKRYVNKIDNGKVEIDSNKFDASANINKSAAQSSSVVVHNSGPDDEKSDLYGDEAMTLKDGTLKNQVKFHERNSIVMEDASDTIGAMAKQFKQYSEHCRPEDKQKNNELFNIAYEQDQAKLNEWAKRYAKDNRATIYSDTGKKLVIQIGDNGTATILKGSDILKSGTDFTKLQESGDKNTQQKINETKAKVKGS